MNYNILIIDDEESICYSIKRILENDKDILVDVVFSGIEGIKKYKEKNYDIVISDLIMEGMNGLEVLKEIKNINNDALVIMITGKGSEQIAAESIKNGAYDYFSKPFNYTDFFKTIRNAKEKIELKSEKERLEKDGGLRHSFYRLDYTGGKMEEIVGIIKKVAVTDCPVMINGESGTGKELIAESIHYASSRKDKAFIKINCGAIPENLMESELFGHEKGAFTGASAAKKGKIELADGGTIFLDEIGEMGADLQVKLLRVLEDGYIDKVGGAKPVKTDVRIVAATNINLENAVKDKSFRLDLYYRLNVFRINVPALRERKDDIIFIAEKMIKEYAIKFGIKPKVISTEAKKMMIKYSWPGNVRELRNVIQNVLILSSGEEIQKEEIRFEESSENDKKNIIDIADMKLTFKEYMKEKEREYLLAMLKKYGENKSEMARVMGVTRRTVYEKMSEHNIEIEFGKYI